ncbi:MAG: tetratricopeptide repeat protein, partial [Myxococcota bacterium]|nr:tetratricopeptide repeat protein [Myxococcota bacterium]
MAINKRRVLDNARKHAQRGAKQRALKEYNKLITADPRDSKLLLEIGDAYRRWGQPEEAVSQYSKVADQYKQEGFDARAVAVLKQILNLDPKRYTAYVNLADLYGRMGLEAEAVSALRTAADGYYREGRRTESLELLRKMATLDPSNTASRLKVADLLQQEGLEEDAIVEYKAVAEELRRQEAHDELGAVYERILEIRPADGESLSARARDLMDLARFEKAEPFAIRALEGIQEPEQFELLIGVYKGLGNEAREAEVTQGLASLYRDRGDEESSREVLQRLSPEVMMEASSFRLDRSEVDFSEIGEEELLPSETFQVTEATDVSECAAPNFSDSETPSRLTQASETVDPTADWMAEASVYLRYGKPPEAIEVLQKVLENTPENREALELLGQAYVDNEQRAEAIDCWREALAVSRCTQDQIAFDALYHRIVDLDPDLADTIEPMASLENSSAALALDPSSLSSVGVSDEGGGVLGSGSEGLAAGLEVELDLESSSGFEVESPLSQSSHLLEVPDSSSAPDLSRVTDPSLKEGFSTPVGAEGGRSTETAAGIREDLEEAAFYLEQGLDAEAEQVYQRILQQAPQHPTALLKLGEVVSRRGGDPSAFVSTTSEPEAKAAGSSGLVGDPCPDDQTEMQDVEDLFGDPGIEIDLEIDEAEASDSSGQDEWAPSDVGSSGEISASAEESLFDDSEIILESSVSPEPLQVPDDEDGGWRAPELAEDLAAVLAEAEAAIEATA